MLCLLRRRHRLFSPNPPIPKKPPKYGANAAPSHDGHWRDALLKNTDEAHYKYDDRTHVLDNDSGVCDQWPEVVGLESGIALEMLEECILISVIVRICVLYVRSLFY